MSAGVLMWARTEWRRRWGSLLLLAGLVAVGGGATITAASAARRTDTAFDRMMQATNHPNLDVSILGTEVEDLDPALLDQVMEIDGVRGATAVGFLAVSTSEFPNFFSFAIIEGRGESWNLLNVDGHTDNISEIGVDEVVINEAMRDQLQVGVGDVLHLESATADQFLESLEDDAELGGPEGPSMTVRVVAVGRAAEEVSDSPDPFLLLSRAFYDTYRDSMWSCRCIVQVLARSDEIDEVAAELALVYPGAVIEPGENLGVRLKDTVALQVSAWILMALTAALAGAFMLLLACSRFVRSVSVADFSHRALGITRRDSQVGRLVIMAPAVVVGALGAGAVAYAMSPLAPVGITLRAEPHPGLDWSWSTGGIGVAVVLTIGLAIASLSSMVVRQRIEVLRGARRGGAVISLGSRLAAGPGRGAVLGVLIATLGVVGSLTLGGSIDHTLATPSLYGADFDANVFEALTSDEQQVATELASDSDIQAVATAWTLGGADNENPLNVVGPGGSIDLVASALESLKGKIVQIVTKGRAPLLPDEVALGPNALSALGVGIGDPVTIEGVTGQVELTVVGEALTIGIDTTGNGFAITLDGLRTLGQPAVESTVIRYADGANPAAVDARHPGVTISPVVPPSEVGNIGQLGDLPAGVAYLLLVLGLFAVLNAVVATISRARREVAIHRALGFTTRQVAGAHLWQNATTTVVGGAIGGFSGFIIGRAIHQRLANDVGAIADTVVPSSIWIVAASATVAMVVAAAITSLLTLRSRPGTVLRAE